MLETAQFIETETGTEGFRLSQWEVFRFMIRVSFTIHNPSGLHARPASVLVGAMGRFNSDVFFFYRGNRYNAKSIINVLSACVPMGETLEFSADGPDEDKVMEAISALVAEGFGEGCIE